MEYESMAYGELKKLHDDIGALLERKKSETLDSLKAQMESLGFTAKDLASKKRVKRASPAVKYQNPENADETWTGRGKPPKWMRDFVDAGKDKEEFAVKENGEAHA